MDQQPRKPDSYLDLLAQSVSSSNDRGIPKLTVSALLAPGSGLNMEAPSGSLGLDRHIRSAVMRRVGLALAGYADELDAGSLLMIGRAERRFMAEQPPESWHVGLDLVFKSEPACLLATQSQDLPEALIERARKAGIALLTSTLAEPVLVPKLGRFLVEQLAPRLCFHGNLLVISGLGVLILGKSGIGKSDDALDLILHGHQLVADDVVRVFRDPMDTLIGRADDLTRYHMNIRGLGIINIKELFGITAVLHQHPIDLVLYLEPWQEGREYDCFGQPEDLEILGIPRPLLRLPVVPGRNLENLIEVAVKGFALRTKDGDKNQSLAARLERKMRNEEP